MSELADRTELGLLIRDAWPTLVARVRHQTGQRFGISVSDENATAGGNRRINRKTWGNREILDLLSA